MEIIIKVEDGVVGNSKSKRDDSIDTRGLSQYARVFDESCVGWTKDAENNKMFLLMQQNYANELLRRKGHLFLNEIFDLLGMARTKVGQIVGWIYDEENLCADNYVDFGIFDEINADFVNGYKNTAWLDFNVDGDILSRL